MRELTTQVELLRDFSPEELEALRAITEIRAFDAGTVILRQGEPVEAIYVLLEGQVRVTAILSEGDEVVGQDEEMLVRLDPGEVFGELSFITGLAPNLSVVAEARCTVAALPQARLHQLINENAAVCRKLLFAITRTLVGRLRSTGRELVLTRYFLRGH